MKKGRLSKLLLAIATVAFAAALAIPAIAFADEAAAGVSCEEESCTHEAAIEDLHYEDLADAISEAAKADESKTVEVKLLVPAYEIKLYPNMNVILDAEGVVFGEHVEITVNRIVDNFTELSSKRSGTYVLKNFKVNNSLSIGASAVASLTVEGCNVEALDFNASNSKVVVGDNTICMVEDAYIKFNGELNGNPLYFYADNYNLTIVNNVIAAKASNAIQIQGNYEEFQKDQTISPSNLLSISKNRFNSECADAFVKIWNDVTYAPVEWPSTYKITDDLSTLAKKLYGENEFLTCNTVLDVLARATEKSDKNLTERNFEGLQEIAKEAEYKGPDGHSRIITLTPKEGHDGVYIEETCCPNCDFVIFSEEKSGYVVALNPNATNAVAPQDEIATDSDRRLPELPTATRPGYVFIGWFTEKTGGSEVEPGQEFDGDTLYAHWAYIPPYIPPAAPSEPVCGPDAACNVFNDADADAWYHEVIDWAYANDILRGYDDGSGNVGPGDVTMRTHVAVMMWRMAGEPAVSSDPGFADVRPGAWYYDAVAWAKEAGLIVGYQDGSGLFGVADPMTREQMATVLYRFAVLMGCDVSVGEDTNILSYLDYAEISEWAIPALQWAVGAGIVSGYTEDGEPTGYLGPKDDAERAHFAAMLMRLDDAYGIL